MFNNKPTENSVLGRLLEGPNDATNKYKGYDDEVCQIFGYNDEVRCLYHNGSKWSAWKTDGTVIASNEEIVVNIMEY